MDFNENVDVTLSNDADFIYHIKSVAKWWLIRGKGSKSLIPFKELRSAVEDVPGNREILERLIWSSDTARKELGFVIDRTVSSLDLRAVRRFLDLRHVPDTRKQVVVAGHNEDVLADLIREARHSGSKEIKLHMTREFLKEVVVQSDKNLDLQVDKPIKYLMADVRVIDSAPNNKLLQNRFALVQAHRFLGIYENTNVALV